MATLNIKNFPDRLYPTNDRRLPPLRTIRILRLETFV